jgi:hypothetical protein
MRAVAARTQQEMTFEQGLAGAELGQYVFILHFRACLSSRSNGRELAIRKHCQIFP